MLAARSAFSSFNAAASPMQTFSCSLFRQLLRRNGPTSAIAGVCQPAARFNSTSTANTTTITNSQSSTQQQSTVTTAMPYPVVNPVLNKGAKGLSEFFDTDKGWYWKDEDATTGRGWTCAELRLKSFDDLHKLWWVCVKEQNKLLSQREEAWMFKVIFPFGQRMRQVRVTMRGIKQVIWERRIAYYQAQAIVERETTRKALYEQAIAAAQESGTYSVKEGESPITPEIKELVEEQLREKFPTPIHEVGRKRQSKWARPPLILRKFKRKTRRTFIV